MAGELTKEQATDLAKYFLGLGWYACENGMGTFSLVDARLGGRAYHAANWREAFRAAGVKLPARSRYTAQGASVMLEDEAIATAKSNTMAKRISEALNRHTPDRRGI